MNRIHTQTRCGDHTPSMANRVRCHHCDDVLGVYEPVVVVLDGQVRETSRAAEPSLPLETAALYHPACYHEHASAAGTSQG